MNGQEPYQFKSKCILMTSVILLLISVVLNSNSILSIENYELTSINIKEMATTSVSIKEGKNKSKKKLIEVKDMPSVDEQVEVKNIANIVNTKVWYLPTEMGTVTQYPSYNHIAFDITSPRGSNEIIYPIASGVISGIYTDNAGALIVTVRHLIDGIIYTSQYVHLSSYANIYLGQEVTPFTPLGWMGTTGWSTGIHLHIALVDCNLFGYTDMCGDYNGFTNYKRIRYSQGFAGIANVMNVPYQWYSR